MCPAIIQRSMAPLLAVILTATTSLAGAQDNDSTPNTTAGATATDILVARPGGLAATVLGTAIFVVGLPFTLINGSTEQSAQQLIVSPANYTFTRPLGQEIGGLGRPGK